MIDHVNLLVTDLQKSKQFYSAALSPIGYGVLKEGEGYCGIGPREEPEKWIGTIWIGEGNILAPTHIAFRVGDRTTVDRFYQAAVSAGGKDNGPPGLRAQYHKNYYAAFVLDPDGHNIEVVCHEEIEG